MISTINKAIPVTWKHAARRDHIATKNYAESLFETAIIKSDVSDHFSICIFPLQILYQQKIKLTVDIKEPLIVKG